MPCGLTLRVDEYMDGLPLKVDENMGDWLADWILGCVGEQVDGWMDDRTTHVAPVS